jgi:hypothetical protein
MCFNINLIRVLRALFLLLQCLLIGGGCGPLHSRSVVESVDDLTRDTYQTYDHGSLAVATNALYSYIRFIDGHKQEVSPYREVDLMLYTAHARLAYMLFRMGNEMGAAQEMATAYTHYKLYAKSQKNLSLVSPDQFVDFALDGVEKTDAAREVAWQGEVAPVNTNTVSHVKAFFKGYK